jgi:uncharacterized protein (DUF1684 family)
VNAKGQELKSNVTDNDSAKMATSKGVIQGYATAHTLITADAGYHSDANLEALKAMNRPAMIADVGMRKRDERLQEQSKHKAQADPLHDKSSAAKSRVYRPEDFTFLPDGRSCICPAGKTLHGSGQYYVANGLEHLKYKGTLKDCVPCPLREQCLIKPEATQFRQVAYFPKGQETRMKTTQLMRQAIDSPKGRTLYSQRIGTVEPVFANLRHNKRLNRFTLRGQCKVNTQWHLYCLVHNIEKMAHNGAY